MIEEEEGVFGFEPYVGPSPTPGTGPHDDFSTPGRKFSFFHFSLKQNISCSVLYFLMRLYLHLLTIAIYKVINKKLFLINDFFLTIRIPDSSYFGSSNCNYKT